MFRNRQNLATGIPPRDGFYSDFTRDAETADEATALQTEANPAETESTMGEEETTPKENLSSKIHTASRISEGCF